MGVFGVERRERERERMERRFLRGWRERKERALSHLVALLRAQAVHGRRRFLGHLLAGGAQDVGHVGADALSLSLWDGGEV
jgi:hypothetical protein